VRPVSEFGERVLRIAGRANVDESVAIAAILGCAGITSTLATITEAEHERALAVARQWDRDDTDQDDPDADTLRRAALQWRERRGEA
jgi:hypothetical protein